MVIGRMDQPGSPGRSRERVLADAEQAVEKRIVEVEFTQQQDVILRRLSEEGRYGLADAEIIQNVFREFLQQTQL